MTQGFWAAKWAVQIGVLKSIGKHIAKRLDHKSAITSATNDADSRTKINTIEWETCLRNTGSSEEPIGNYEQ